MNSIAKFVSLIALAVTVLPSVLYFSDMLSIEFMKRVALAGTVAWFISASMWMGRNESE